MKCSINIYFFFRELFAGFGFSGRIADASSKIANNQMDLMAQILKLAQLIQNHSMSKMDVLGGWIHAQFDL